MSSELQTLKKENDEERELHSKLRGYYDQLKARFEEASAKLLKMEEDAAQLKQRVKDDKQTITGCFCCSHLRLVML